MNECQTGERIRGILLSSKHRQIQFTNGRVTQFVQEHEQHIAGYEFCELFTTVGRNALQLRLVAAPADRFIDPGLKALEVCGRRLRRCLAKADEDKRQQKQQPA